MSGVSRGKVSKPVDYPRQLMIKTKVVQRMMKEVRSYEKEVVENTEKIGKMEREGADFHDVKKFREVLAESEMMVPDSKNRLRKNIEDLRSFVETAKDENGVKESEWWATHEEVLRDYDKDSGQSAQNDAANEPCVTSVEGLAEGEAF